MVSGYGKRLLAATFAATVLLAGGCGSGGGGSNGSGGHSGQRMGRRSKLAAVGAAGGGSAGGGRVSSRRRVGALIPPPNPTPRTVHVPVLTYHRVVSLPAVGQLDLIVDPANFAAELAALARAGYHTITQARLFGGLYRGARLPSKPILISVDDGYVDDVRTILPDLERYHMVATFFVITGRMSEPGFLSAAQIRALDRAGMDIGDHTAHHVDLALLSSAQLRTETAGSRHALEAVVGHPVYSFAYPFGAYDAAAVAAVRAAGFTFAYTTTGGTTESTRAPLTMPRIHVGRSETPEGLLSLLGGGT